MAIEADVPILPVTIRGANKVWAREMKYPHPFQKVEVIYHPLLQVSPPAAGVDAREHAREATLKLKKIIEQGL
jgi:1-acyl-sn-glycerol-3-phosphate acyltransferase